MGGSNSGSGFLHEPFVSDRLKREALFFCKLVCGADDSVPLPAPVVPEQHATLAQDRPVGLKVRVDVVLVMAGVNIDEVRDNIFALEVPAGDHGRVGKRDDESLQTGVRHVGEEIVVQGWVAVLGELLEAPVGIVAADVLDAAQPRVHADQGTVDAFLCEVRGNERCGISFPGADFDDQPRVGDFKNLLHELRLADGALQRWWELIRRKLVKGVGQPELLSKCLGESGHIVPVVHAGVSAVVEAGVVQCSSCAG